MIHVKMFITMTMKTTINIISMNFQNIPKTINLIIFAILPMFKMVFIDEYFIYYFKERDTLNNVRQFFIDFVNCINTCNIMQNKQINLSSEIIHFIVYYFTVCIGFPIIHFIENYYFHISNCLLYKSLSSKSVIVINKYKIFIITINLDIFIFDIFAIFNIVYVINLEKLLLYEFTLDIIGKIKCI